MRAVVALAIRTAIPVSAWLAEDDRTLHTAFDLIHDEDDRGRGRDSGGPVMSG